MVGNDPKAGESPHPAQVVKASRLWRCCRNARLLRQKSQYTTHEEHQDYVAAGGNHEKCVLLGANVIARRSLAALQGSHLL
jgi:hypothetical protein